MSSGKKTMLVIATVLVIGGCAVAFGAFAAAGFDYRNLSTESRNWTSATKMFDAEADGPHTAIVVRDAGENVRIEATDGDAIEVTYWTSDTKNVEVTDDGGTIVVEGSHVPRIEIMRIGSFEDRSTVVKVPRAWAGTLDIDVMGGNVDVSDLSELGSVTAKTASGNVELDRLGAVDIVTSAASGNVQVLRTRAASVTATTMSGNVALTDVEASDAVRLDTASGGQVLQGVSTTTLDARMGSGDITATGLAVADAKFDAVSGNVTSSFTGTDDEYSIEASSVSGEVRSPAGSAAAEKRVSAHTMSGDVTIMFSGGGEGVRSNGSGGGGGGAPSAPEAPAAPEAPSL